MNKIKFSHRYEKFGTLDIPLKAVLLQIFRIDKSSLSIEFLSYDTRIQLSHENYDIKANDLIVLLLKLPNEFLLTTIRKYTKEKWNYYKNLEGKIVELAYFI